MARHSNEQGEKPNIERRIQDGEYLVTRVSGSGYQEKRLSVGMSDLWLLTSENDGLEYGPSRFNKQC